MARQRRRCRTERSRPRDLDVLFALIKKGNWSADQPSLPYLERKQSWMVQSVAEYPYLHSPWVAAAARRVASFVFFRTANLLRRLEYAQRIPNKYSIACAISVHRKISGHQFSRRLRQQPKLIVAGLRHGVVYANCLVPGMLRDEASSMVVYTPKHAGAATEHRRYPY
ncbi:uncharacterized protein TRIVIDRAFT_64422 [Trichoderma virens Gv29-8]|uniref:Uncharacterized protein n=1 Tax=Hypocrea virens (strain Gv29-8 / FGSC 10586) TaxID=413071 RepID=G9NDC1_HYPVG|nr:uncharacterized protein TRIVIDRAFT_64422 [Trichoderma virens Gv29-8]EHK15688.1 hypothetical protein TRIVIDRAFT_64422 [Trichoderma virens Gv29-8]